MHGLLLELISVIRHASVRFWCGEVVCGELTVRPGIGTVFYDKLSVSK
jgi:hypothetical protein